MTRLLCVRLVLRTRLVERGQLAQGRIDREDFCKALERDLEAPGIVDLRDEADIGEGHVRAERIGAGLDARLDRLEAGVDPRGIPGVDRRLIELELVLEILERAG